MKNNKKLVNFEELKSYVNIKNVLSNYVHINKNGSTNCPFHKETIPSLYIYEKTNTFHCFGCKKSGDVFTFLMEYKNISFIDSVKEVCDYYNLEFKDDYKNNPLNLKTKQMSEIYNKINNRYKSNLNKDMICKNFLYKKRNLNQETINDFELGCSNGKFDADFLIKNKILNNDELFESNNYYYCNKSKSIEPFFKSMRITIPIKNENGEIVAFSSRSVMDKDKDVKYKNSKESLVFKKNKILFGFDIAKKYIRKEQKIIIVEGYFDVFKLHQFGVKNVVAVMGTSLSQHHVNLFKRICNEVILFFDGDDAGKKATLKSIDILLQNELNANVLMINKLDPDEMVDEKGIEHFKQMLIKNTIEGFKYRIDNILSRYDKSTIYGKEMIIKNCYDFSKKINNDVITNSIINILHYKLDMNKNILERYFSSIDKKIILNDNKIEKLEDLENETYKEYQKRMMSCLINICNEKLYIDSIRHVNFNMLLDDKDLKIIADFIKRNIGEKITLDMIKSEILKYDMININIIDDLIKYDFIKDFTNFISYAKTLYIKYLEHEKNMYTNKVVENATCGKFEEIEVYDIKRKEIMKKISNVRAMPISKMVY